MRTTGRTRDSKPTASGRYAQMRNEGTLGPNPQALMSLCSGERQLYRIYALVDPLTGDPHYVGQTAASLADRRRDQVRKPGNAKKGAWVRELLVDDRKPKIALIEELPATARTIRARVTFSSKVAVRGVPDPELA